MIPLARQHDAYLHFVINQLNLMYPSSKTFLQDFFADQKFWITSIVLSQTALLMKTSIRPKP